MRKRSARPSNKPTDYNRSQGPQQKTPTIIDEDTLCEFEARDTCSARTLDATATVLRTPAVSLGLTCFGKVAYARQQKQSQEDCSGRVYAERVQVSSLRFVTPTTRRHNAIAAHTAVTNREQSSARVVVRPTHDAPGSYYVLVIHILTVMLDYLFARIEVPYEK